MKKKTISEQVRQNVEEYLKMKNGEPNNVKAINVEFLDLVEKVADKNSDTLAALAEVEKGETESFHTVDELFDDLNSDDGRSILWFFVYLLAGFLFVSLLYLNVARKAPANNNGKTKSRPGNDRCSTN